jgi:RHS repeat-associated protein
MARALPSVAATSVNYVFTDHLGTPRVITRATDNQMVWRWDQADPFGVAQPNENPAGLGNFKYNPRFPGQLFDAETGLYYNYHRHYDPRTGTYTQSDPIGLGGGINTYAYVGGNPVNAVDPLGLETTYGMFRTDNPFINFNPTGYGEGVHSNYGFNSPIWTAATLANYGSAASGVYGISRAIGGYLCEGFVANSVSRVGRWMSETEFQAMQNSGRVVESQLKGITSVSSPPNPTAWVPKGNGSPAFAEFDIPSSSLRASDGVWGKIYGPNSIFGFAGPPVVPRPIIESIKPLEEVTRPVERQVEHHSDPKFMGGDPKQETTRIPESQHQDLHRDMNDFMRQQTDDLGNHMSQVGWATLFCPRGTNRRCKRWAKKPAHPT